MIQDRALLPTSSMTLDELFDFSIDGHNDNNATHLANLCEGF